MASDVLSGEKVAVLERLRDLSDHSVNLDRHQLLQTMACPRSVLASLKARLRPERGGCPLGKSPLLPLVGDSRICER